MSDPTLGFNVDTGGLDKGADSLDKLTQSAQRAETQAAKTGESVNKLGQQFVGLGSAASGGSFKGVSDQFASMASGIAKANAELAKTEPALQGMGSAISAAISKSSASFAEMSKGISAANGGLVQHVGAVNTAAAAHGAMSTQAMAAFHSIRSVTEGVLAGQPPIQSLTQQLNHLSYAASGPGGVVGAFKEVATMIGPTGLIVGGAAIAAAAFSGIAVSLTKVSDEAARAKNDLAAITGSATAGNAAFDLIKKSANSAGVEFGSLKAAVDKAQQGFDKFDNGFPFRKDTDPSTAIKELTATFITLDKVMKSSGATSSEVASVQKTLAQSIASTGSLTAEAFAKIRDESPALARSIASAFNYKSVNEFDAQLQQTPISIQQLINAVNKIKPAIDQNFDISKPKTFEQATDDLTRAWRELLETLANTGVFGVVTSAVEGVAGGIRSTAKDIEVLIGLLQTLGSVGQSVASAVGNAASVAGGNGQGGSGNAQYTPAGDIAGFASGGSFTVGGSGGTDSQLIQFMATPGEQVTIDAPGASNGAGAKTLGELIPGHGGAEGSTDLTSAHLSDAIKTQTTTLSDRINSSRDAIVTAVNNSAAKTVTATAPAATPSIAAVASSASSPSAASSVSSVGGGGGGGRGSSKSDGEFGSPWSLHDDTKKSSEQDEAKAPEDQQASQARSIAAQAAQRDADRRAEQDKADKDRAERAREFDEKQAQEREQADRHAEQSYSPPSKPRENNYTQGRAAPAQFPAGAGDPWKNFLDGIKPKGDDQGVKQQTETLKQTQSSGSKTVADAVKSGEQVQKSVGDKTNQSLDSVEQATKQSGEQMGSIKDASQATSDSITQGNEEAQQAAQDLQDTSQQTTDASKETSDATKEGTDATKEGTDATKQTGDETNQTISDASQDQVSTLNDGAQTVSEAVDKNADTIVSAIQSLDDSISDALASSGSSTSSGASSQSSEGFATGGQFTVSGQGGTDSQHVEFMATPGEVVTITPPGGQVPHNPTMGSTPDKSGIRAFATGGQFEVGTTLGDAFGAPTVAKSSADLIRAHVSEMLGKQQAALGTKIDLVGQNIINASNASTTSIKGAISAVASSIPDPVATVAASSNSGTSGSSSSGGAQPYNGYNALIQQRYGGALATSGNPNLIRMFTGQPLVSYNDIMQARYGTHFAAGGQFAVQGQGGTDSQHIEFMATPGEVVTITPPGGQAPHDPTMGAPPKSAGSMKGFATGGQFTVGNDNAVGTDTLSTWLNSKTQGETAKTSDHIGAMGSKIAASISSSTNTIIAGVNAIGSRFDAWHNSVDASPKTATGVAPFSGMAEGGTFIVPGGTSGNDSVEVGIKASPGERIMVLPPEKADQFKSLASTIKVNPEPLSKFMPDTPAISGSSPQTNWKGNDNIPGARFKPSPSMMPESARATVGKVIPNYDPSSNPDRSAKNVNIFVQQGVQADQFIRSRAEIQRSMSR